jgi:hypothetical protein
MPMPSVGSSRCFASALQVNAFMLWVLYHFVLEARSATYPHVEERLCPERGATCFGEAPSLRLNACKPYL